MSCFLQPPCVNALVHGARGSRKTSEGDEEGSVLSALPGDPTRSQTARAPAPFQSTDEAEAGKVLATETRNTYASRTPRARIESLDTVSNEDHKVRIPHALTVI